MRSFPLAILLACGATPKQAIEVASPLPPTSSAPAASSAVDAGEVIARDEWRAELEAEWPTANCQEYTWYLICFSVTRAECESSIRPLIHACVEESWSDVPPRLGRRSWDNAYFRRIFECSMTRYAEAHAAKQDPRASCRAHVEWDAGSR